MKRSQRAASIQAARRLLRLSSSTTLVQIKQSYRDLARDVHPDMHPHEERDLWDARMRELNAAYELLTDYCERYTFSFAEDVVERQCRKQDPFEYWQKQFVE